MKKALKIVLIVLLAILLLAAAYIAYVFISYHRLGSGPIEVAGAPEADLAEASRGVPGGAQLQITSWNIGFGAYEDDYGFFMDGGTESWAWSKERLNANLADICRKLEQQRSDFYLIQEVDFDATRSYHVDERVPLADALGAERAWTFAQNYDSPFLMYPLTQPHGASRAGLMTFSAYPIRSAERVELPIENGFTKLLDLDRCYSKQYIPINGGAELVLYNFHLSAYTSDGTIANEQLRLLLEDMQAEYDAGNACIAGGDFNKDILGDSSVYFGASDIEYTWAQPIPEGTLDGFSVSLAAPLDEANPVPSCRNADGPYHEGQYVLTIDGFLVTDDVEVLSAEVIDTGFKNSDHNPVRMEFSIKDSREANAG